MTPGLGFLVEMGLIRKPMSQSVDSQCDEFLEDKAPACGTDLLQGGRELGSCLAASLTYQELNKHLQSEGASASFGTSEGRQKTAEYLTCCLIFQETNHSKCGCGGYWGVQVT